MNCPLCGEPIEDPEAELCPSCHRAFNDEFAPENLDLEVKRFTNTIPEID